MAERPHEILDEVAQHRVLLPRLATKTLCRRDATDGPSPVTNADEGNQTFTTILHVELRLNEDIGLARPRTVWPVQQGLTNLVANAMKLLAKQTRVPVGTEAGADGATTSAPDFSPGIPDSLKPHLFKRFARAEMGDAYRSRGTGLRLSTFKAIIEQHGGTFSYASQMPDRCSRFWTRLAHLHSSATGIRPAGAMLEEYADDR